jgi:hypothetical protein
MVATRIFVDEEPKELFGVKMAAGHKLDGIKIPNVSLVLARKSEK